MDVLAFAFPPAQPHPTELICLSQQNPKPTSEISQPPSRQMTTTHHQHLLERESEKGKMHPALEAAHDLPEQEPCQVIFSFQSSTARNTSQFPCIICRCLSCSEGCEVAGTRQGVRNQASCSFFFHTCSDLKNGLWKGRGSHLSKSLHSFL